jgi:hypothetical protein
VNRDTEQARDDANMLWLFAFLWAAAHGYHEAKWSYWLSTPSDFAVGVSVALVLLRPSAVWRLALLAAVQLLSLAGALPYASNHWLVVSFVDLSLLVAIASAAWTGSGRVEPSRVWRQFAPASRAIVVVVYGWAAFHKLNADWFDPTVSCAGRLMNDWARLFPFVPGPGGVYAAMPWIAVGIEIAIPALLLIRRGRFAGIVLALAFHFALGVPHFFHFSAIMLALFLPFAPNRFVSAADAWTRDRAWAARIRQMFDSGAVRHLETAAYVGLILAVCAVVAMSPWTYAGIEPVLVREVGSGVRTTWSYVFQAFWFPYYLGAAVLFVVIRRRTESDNRTGAELLRASSTLLYVVPVLALLNGTLPYVGLKTEGAFGMFSNLRTEGDRPNHYFVGGLVDPFGWQADLVRVESSDDPELAKLADRELSIPLFELSSYLVRSKAGKENAIDLTYERAGVSVRTADAAADPALQFRSGPLAAKLLAFRPIEADGPVHCRH